MQYQNVINEHVTHHPAVIPQLLHGTRDPLCSYFRTCCRSFSQMDCNAQFSEIFQTKNFTDMNAYEKEIFLTRYTYNTLCSTCDIPLTKHVTIFVNFVRYTDLLSQSMNVKDWPLYLSCTNSRVRTTLQSVVQKFRVLHLMTTQFASERTAAKAYTSARGETH